MKTPQMIQWAEFLQTTDLPQTKAHLKEVRLEDGLWETVGYCCLGIGCLIAGIDEEIPNENDMDGLNEFAYFGGQQDLAPGEFIQWLGLIGEDQALYLGDGSDLWIDGGGYTVRKGDLLEVQFTVPLTVLNDDWRLTFAQIGDCIKYFGLTFPG